MWALAWRPTNPEPASYVTILADWRSSGKVPLGTCRGHTYGRWVNLSQTAAFDGGAGTGWR